MMSESRGRQPGTRWTIQRGRTLALLAWVGIAFAAACGGDATGPSAPKSPVGVYAVSTINGKPLPYTMFADTGFTYEELAGTLSLASDGNYMFVTTTRQTVLTDVETFVDTSSGTWTESGTTLHFVDAADSSSTGTAVWTGTQLTFSFADVGGTTTVVYVRKP